MKTLSPFSLLLLLLLTACVVTCKKKPADSGSGTASGLTYGDSVFYLRAQAYTVSPLNAGTGTYTAFPDNLQIDPATGRITVTMMGRGGEPQTGLRYKIRFQPAGSTQADSTYIVLAGLNYLDKIYNLALHDSIIYPVYNGNINAAVPSGTYGIAADGRLSIAGQNGAINIRECIRRGLFELPVENGEWEELAVQYKSNDASGAVTNRIDVALYYYDSMADVPYNVSEVMRAHQRQVLGVPQQPIPVTTGPFDGDLPDNLSLTKPRPPCIIVIAH